MLTRKDYQQCEVVNGMREKALDATLPAGYGRHMTNDTDRTTVRLRRSDPLGYDTRRPFLEVAREMAADALAGRHQDAVDAELEAVRRRWRLHNDD